MMFEKLMSHFDGSKTGVFERIDFTFGSRGHQLMSIDGEKYAIWLDYREFPSKGQIVKHKPYFQHGMRCTRILEIDGLPMLK